MRLKRLEVMFRLFQLSIFPLHTLSTGFMQATHLCLFYLKFNLSRTHKQDTQILLFFLPSQPPSFFKYCFTNYYIFHSRLLHYYMLLSTVTFF